MCRRRVERGTSLDSHFECELIESFRLMLREPGSLYVAKRSKTLLKVKTFLDAEAVVVGYEDGKVRPSPPPLYAVLTL